MHACSIVSGFIIGMIYGLFFLFQRRRVLFSVDTDVQRSLYIILKVGLYACVRLVFLALFLAYLLRYAKINGISFIISFFCAFWLTIINMKALLHGKC